MKHELFSEEWLLESVSPEPNSGCWLWTKGSNGSGKKNAYGRFRQDGQLVLAHRAFYERYVGPIDDGQHVMHRCDNPACVNYENHLTVGSHADNMRDKVAKGRHARGDAVAHSGESHWTKLSPEKILRGAEWSRCRRKKEASDV